MGPAQPLPAGFAGRVGPEALLFTRRRRGVSVPDIGRFSSIYGRHEQDITGRLLIPGVGGLLFSFFLLSCIMDLT